MSNSHVSRWKTIFFLLIIAVGGFFGTVYGIDLYPKMFHTDLSIEKNQSIDPVDPIVIDFSRPVDTGGYQGSATISPSADFSIKWENGNKKLTISPKTFWKPQTQYSLNLPQGKTKFFTKIEPAVFQFTTMDFPKITDVYPQNGAKDVGVDIEDPIVLNFNEPLGNFFIKADLSPGTGVAYQHNDDRTQFKLLPNGGMEYGTDYDMKVYIKYANDSDSNYHQIYESSFSTAVPPVIVWDKDFSVRIEQAKKYTMPKIAAGKYIDVNLKAQVMTTFEDGKLLDAYMVSSGKASMPTPKGQFSIHNKTPRAWSKEFGLYMPWWNAVASDGSFGIHELPEWPGGYKEGAAHLGTPVSHGCIRLGVGPAKIVYDWAPIGTPVIIY